MANESARTALVTGGFGGIGLAIVRRLLNLGHNVVALDRVTGGEADARLSTVSGGAQDRAVSLAGDVTDPEQVERAVADTVARFGGLEILVNVAGGSGPTRVRDIEAIDLETWDHVIDLNVRSTFLCCRAAVPHMRAAGFGRIVNFSSILARGEAGPVTTVAGRLPYATAKAALIGFTAQLAKDVAEDGITVNALTPGLILGDPGTRIRDRFDALPESERQRMLRRYPGGRPGTADEVAAAVEFLVSPAAGYVSGAALPIDGAGA